MFLILSTYQTLPSEMVMKATNVEVAFQEKKFQERFSVLFHCIHCTAEGSEGTDISEIKILHSILPAALQRVVRVCKLC